MSARRKEDLEQVQRQAFIGLTGLKPLERDDYIAAAAYAASCPADPFAYARALSRLRNWYAAGDIGG